MSDLKSFTHGVFEILLPGSFLLVNIAVFLCIAAGISPAIQLWPSADFPFFLTARFALALAIFLF